MHSESTNNSSSSPSAIPNANGKRYSAWQLDTVEHGNLRLSDLGVATKTEPNRVLSRKTFRDCFLDRTAVFAFVIAFTGAGVACAFLGLGLVGANRDQDLQFARKASEIVIAVKDSWDDYVGAALWIHEACRSTSDQKGSIGNLKICTREDFQELFEYLMADKDLALQGMGFAPWVTNEERPILEREASRYYAESYPNVRYHGFTGRERLPSGNGTTLWMRSKQANYLPAHYVEPVLPNQDFLGFDILSMAESARPADIDLLLEWSPVVTDRIDLAYELPHSNYELGYYVVLMHPGIRLAGHANIKPDSCSELFLKVSTIIKMALLGQMTSNISVYLFDVNKNNTGDQFLGWGDYDSSTAMPYGPDASLTALPTNSSVKKFDFHNVDEEPKLDDLKAQRNRCTYETIPIAQNTW